jgi:hypothetical protein
VISRKWPSCDSPDPIRPRGAALRLLHAFSAKVLLLGAALALFGGRADAQEIYVETAGVATREDALAALQRVQEAGFQAQIIRRFRRGEGWQYVLRTEALAGQDEAAKAAEGIGKAASLGATVFQRVGADALPLAVAQPASTTGPATPVGPVETSPQAPSAKEHPESANFTALGQGDPVAGRELLAAVVRAHGSGVDGSAVLSKAQTLHFRFERRVWPDDGEPVRVWNDYWRDHERIRMEVRVLEGKGKNSVTLVDRSQAWLLVDGKIQQQDAVGIGDALQVFTPERILNRALQLGKAAQAGGARLLGTESLEGRTLARLVVDDGRDDGVSETFGIDDVDHRVREISMKADVGEVLWRYRDYHELDDGLVVPFQVDIWRQGELKEQIAILELSTSARADADLFTPAKLQPPPAGPGAPPTVSPAPPTPGSVDGSPATR